MTKPLRNIALSFFAAVIILELSIRIFLAFIVGPDVLMYGTRFGAYNTKEKEWKKTTGKEGSHNVADHSNKQSNYGKYYPNQKRKDNDKHGSDFEVKINSQGFRGHDFSTVKDSNKLRIITLGASSTFGYGGRDDETYPFYLEQLLNKYLDTVSGSRGLQVEVYNMGIPHLISEQILSLFESEALTYQPDIVTFYEGVNDCAMFTRRETPFAKAARRLIILRFLSEVMKQSEAYGYGDYVRISREAKKKFSGNVQKIAASCRSRNTPFYLITQQSKSLMFSTDKLKTMTYNDEQKKLRQQMKRQKLTLNEFYFVLHGDMMDYIRTKRNELQIIEGIYALDSSRNELTSWVHLTPKANGILAKAIADRIIEDKALEK